MLQMITSPSPKYVIYVTTHTHLILTTIAESKSTIHILQMGKQMMN